MWIVASLVIVIVILMSIIWIISRARYTPDQEQARAHIIAAFGLEGGMIFHTVMVLSGSDKMIRNEQARRLIEAYRMGQGIGIEATKQCVANLCSHYVQNPQELNRTQGVALKMCIEHNILEKMMKKEAA